MTVSLRLEPKLPPNALAEVRDVGPGLEPRQPVSKVPAFFGVGAPAMPGRRGLLLGWEKHTHPEGINYYTDNGNRILTFVDPQVPENLDRLRSAFREIEALLPLDRRGENTHIVLSFTKKQFQQGIVQYYIADYASQQVCWVHDVDVQSIGLQPYPSEECRRSMLLSYFWTHVHHFPVIAPLDVEMETRSLIGALNRGRMPDYDYLIPWTWPECAVLLRLLGGPMTFPLQYRVTIIGRLNTTLSKHRHGLRWDSNNNELPLLPRRRNNDPTRPVPRRRVHAGEHLEFVSLGSVLVMFLLLSAYMIFDAVAIVWNGSSDRVTLMLTVLSSLPLSALTSPFNTLQRLDPHLVTMLARRPWLSVCLAFLVSFDLVVYALLLDSAVYMLVHHSHDLGNDRTIQVALKLILPPALATFVLAVRDGRPRLTPT